MTIFTAFQDSFTYYQQENFLKKDHQIIRVPELQGMYAGNQGFNNEESMTNSLARVGARK